MFSLFAGAQRRGRRVFSIAGADWGLGRQKEARRPIPGNPSTVAAAGSRQKPATILQDLVGRPARLGYSSPASGLGFTLQAAPRCPWRWTRAWWCLSSGSPPATARGQSALERRKGSRMHNQTLPSLSTSTFSKFHHTSFEILQFGELFFRYFQSGSVSSPQPFTFTWEVL